MGLDHCVSSRRQIHDSFALAATLHASERVVRCTLVNPRIGERDFIKTGYGCGVGPSLFCDAVVLGWAGDCATHAGNRVVSAASGLSETSTALITDMLRTPPVFNGWRC